MNESVDHAQIEALASSSEATDRHSALERAIDLALEPTVQVLARQLARDPEAWVRDAAAEAFGWLSDPADMPYVLRLTRDRTWIVRCSAVSSLAEYKIEEATSQILRLLHRDPNPTVRRWAAVSLIDQGRLSRDQIRARLRERLEVDKHPVSVAGLNTLLICLGETRRLADLLAFLTPLHGRRGYRVRQVQWAATSSWEALSKVLGPDDLAALKRVACYKEGQ